MVRKISVRGIALHKGKLLGVRLTAYKESLQKHGHDFWCLPGGGLDQGEALVDGIEREMIEETGIKPVVGNLLYVQQFTQGDQEFLEFFFHIVNAEDYLQVDLTQTTHGEAEIEQIDFIDPATSHLLPPFLSTEDLARVTASNGPTRVFSY